MDANLLKELKTALNYLDIDWNMQNNYYDIRSNFIYSVRTVDECIKKADEFGINRNYALHRWFNFITSIECQNIFVEFGAKQEENKKHRKIDIYIDGVPFDVKLTVYPAKLSDHPYNLNTRAGKNDMIRWLDANQSQEQRKHLANRLFIVCDGSSRYESLCLKADFKQIREKISSFMDFCGKFGFNKLDIYDNNNKFIVYSDIIYICGFN